jgi:thiamine kinase
VNDDYVAARAAAEPSVRAKLASQPALAWLSEAEWRPITGGVTNFAWHASAARGDAFVRYGHTPQELGTDPHGECAVLGIVANAGIAPPVLRCDPVERLLVTRWIAADLPQVSAPTSVATALARLHALHVPPALRRVDFAHQAIVLATQANVSPSTDLVSCAARVHAGLGASAANAVICHNDLNPANLVTGTGGRVWLVDWEYAGVGDAVYDLASYASQHRLDPAARAAFINDYVRAGGRADVARLDAATWSFDYVQWLWYRSLLHRGGPVTHPERFKADAAALETDLRRRASGVLRCNN